MPMELSTVSAHTLTGSRAGMGNEMRVGFIKDEVVRQMILRMVSFVNESFSEFVGELVSQLKK